MRNTPHTTETKEKISLSLKGRSVWNAGVPMSEETKKKLSASLKGKVAWNKGMVSPTLDAGRIRLGRKMRARDVVERVIGRPLRDTEVVHHIDEDKLNDTQENLYLFRTTSAHTRFHHYLRRHNLCGVLTSNLSLYAN